MRKIAEIFKLIKFPKGLELLILLAIVGAFGLFNAFTICGDCFFGYAITERIVHPEWFHASDLVVSSGAGNFLFYRILAKLPLFVDNYNLRDFVLTVPVTLLLVLAWYNVFSEVTKNKKLVIFSIFFLLFSDTKLFLHGYPIPFFILTSIGSIHFLQVFAFFFFLKQKHTLAFALLAISSYLHPASGLVYVIILSLCILWESVKSKNYQLALKPILVAGAIMLPNILFLGGNLAVNKTEQARIFELTIALRQFTSILIGDYFSKTYFYTFSAFGLAALLYFRRKTRFEHERVIMRFLTIGFVGSMLWLLNLYYIQNLNVFYTLYIARSFYIIKPLLVMYIVWVFYDLFVRKNIFLKITSLLVAATFLKFSSFYGGLILLAASAFYFFEDRFAWLREKDAPKGEKRSFKVLIFFVIVAGILFGYQRGNKFGKIYQLLRGKNVFNFSFDFNQNYSISKTNPEFSELVDWAKQYRGKLFLVPIDGRNDFVYFRYLTKNGIYANIDDMGQLTYSPKDFLEGFRRMTLLGFRIDEAGQLDFAQYGSIGFDKLRLTGADFAIFDKKSPGYIVKSETAVFETDRYVVFKLR